MNCAAFASGDDVGDVPTEAIHGTPGGLGQHVVGTHVWEWVSMDWYVRSDCRNGGRENGVTMREARRVKCLRKL